MAEKSVIIVGGGSGKRMGSDIPKQFLTMGGKPMIIHTIDRFIEAIPEANIIIVLPEAHLRTFFDIAEDYYFNNVIVVKGGATRFQSVKNGLSEISGSEDHLIAIHDAVRPFITKELIGKLFEEAAVSGAVIPVVPVKESIRKVENERSESVDRSLYKLVQTPQCFKWDILSKAYLQEEDSKFTDDASVVESSGVKVTMIPGEEQNIKITHPEDILLAEFILKSKNTN